MEKFKIIELGYNYWNRFTFEFITIEIGNFEGTLIGLNFGKGFCNLDILFFNLEIKSPSN